ncbi:MAG: MBL fold metallo-hydrolase [Myxococcales bacterium]|nr:MBL fold metallo-hydrolase [Myxococcales bacterium]
MLFRQLFDLETSTYTYLLADDETREAVLIDSVKEQVDRDLQIVDELDLKLVYTLETHVHADHITGASEIRNRVGTRSVVAAEGGASCGDLHVRDGDRVQFGRHALVVRTTPGHTDGCLSFVLDDQSMAFTGDALLIRGCGRTDFQQGDAHRLYSSVHDKLFSLPEHAKIYPGHDYKGRTVSTVGEEKQHNPRLGMGKTEEQFVEIMSNLKLAQPKKIDVAVPANLNCGVRAVATAPANEGGSPFVAGEVVEVDPPWVANNAKGVFLLDVRELSEFHGELGRVPGSVLVPLGELAAKVGEWERGRPIVTICRTGERSLSAAHVLREAGFREVASMRGGMLAWGSAGLPTTRG